MHLAGEMLRAKQREVRTAGSEEPLLFKVGEQVWLENKRRRKGENTKLQPKYVGPFEVIASRKNHTYLIERNQQSSWQNECRLKIFRPCDEPSGKGPCLVEPRRHLNMKGNTRRTKKNRGFPNDYSKK